MHAIAPKSVPIAAPSGTARASIGNRQAACRLVSRYVMPPSADFWTPRRLLTVAPVVVFNRSGDRFHVKPRWSPVII